MLAALSALIVVILAAVFSLLHNAPGPRDASIEARSSVPKTPATTHAAAGRAIYDKLGCGGCHSIGGQGNPRIPLDSVALHRSPKELRDWIVAADSVRPRLSASVARMKQSYASMPEEELQALLDYLVDLRESSESR
jgi:mono/diheme cytochrome c family protein